jgi:DNA polymerase-3 subunit epsilon
MIISLFDCESTGLHSSALVDNDKKPETTEFMCIKYDFDKDAVVKEYEFFVKTKRPIPKEVIDITGITNEMIADALPFSARIAEVRDALENADAILAHNLAYDKELIETEFLRCNEKIKFPRLICTVEQTICIKGYRLSLSDLHKDLTGEPFAGAHRARVDVEALLRCVKILITRGFI